MLPTSNLMKGLKRQEVQGPLLTDQMRPRTTGFWNSNTYTLSSVLHQPRHSHLHPPLSYTSHITHTYTLSSVLHQPRHSHLHLFLCPTPAASLTPTFPCVLYQPHHSHLHTPLCVPHQPCHSHLHSFLCPTPATSLTPTFPCVPHQPRHSHLRFPLESYTSCVIHTRCPISRTCTFRPLSRSFLF